MDAMQISASSFFTKSLSILTIRTNLPESMVLYACRRGQENPEKTKGEIAMLIALAAAAVATVAAALIFII